ncbi:12699_t:CDS:1, partial [Dentiscutata heterogama]
CFDIDKFDLENDFWKDIFYDSENELDLFEDDNLKKLNINYYNDS